MTLDQSFDHSCLKSPGSLINHSLSGLEWNSQLLSLDLAQASLFPIRYLWPFYPQLHMHMSLFDRETLLGWNQVAMVSDRAVSGAGASWMLTWSLKPQGLGLMPSLPLCEYGCSSQLHWVSIFLIYRRWMQTWVITALACENKISPVHHKHSVRDGYFSNVFLLTIPSGNVFLTDYYYSRFSFVESCVPFCETELTNPSWCSFSQVSFWAACRICQQFTVLRLTWCTYTTNVFMGKRICVFPSVFLHLWE